MCEALKQRDAVARAEGIEVGRAEKKAEYEKEKVEYERIIAELQAENARLKAEKKK